MALFGYARVSTQAQDFSLQVAELERQGVPTENIYKEKYTGKTVDRPEFQKLLKKLKEGDTLKVTKLDRLARTAVEGITIVRELVEKGVAVHVLNMGLAEDTSNGRLMLTILNGFAEFERDLIVERTQAGKARAIEKAKAEGRDISEAIGGRPKIHKNEKRAHAMELRAEGYTQKEVCNKLGFSLATMKRIEAEARQKEGN